MLLQSCRDDRVISTVDEIQNKVYSVDVSCNDSNTKQTAIEIIQSQLKKAVWYNQIGIALSGEPEMTSIKTITKDNSLSKAECSGKYSFIYNGKMREIKTSYNLSYLEDKKDIEVEIDVETVVIHLMSLVGNETPIKNGLEKIFDPKTGNLQSTIELENSVKNGIEKIFDPNTGNLKSMLEWKNGVQDGLQENYNPVNNKLIAQIHLINGVKSGLEKGWDSNGSELLIDLNWVNGKPNGFEKHKNAAGDKLITDVVFVDGKVTGFITTGNPDSYGDVYYYKDGLYHGTHYYYSNYNNKRYLEKIETFKNGKLDGLMQEFGPDGIVQYEKNYRDGIEVPVTHMEGVIFEYKCGDNCYLTIKDKAGVEHIGLCAASLCQSWNKNAEMPSKYKGKKVRVNIVKGMQYDGGGNPMNEMDAFGQVDVLNQ